MCGIFFFIGNKAIKRKKELEKKFYKIKHRGPDASQIRYYNSNVMVGFHRLAIIDPTGAGMQPFENQRYACVVNGEIYNYKQLIQGYSLDVETHSDCEVILPLFLKDMNIESLCHKLDGEFAFIIYDTFTKTVFFAVDEIRARPLFLGESEEGIYLCSEQKSLKHCDKVIPIPSGCYGKIQDGESSHKFVYSFTNYYNFNISSITREEDRPDLYLRKLLMENVSKKLHPEREYCFLLSGGLDSSLICGIAAKLCAPNRIHTFTVGFDKNASDVIAARKVAKHIDSIHTEFIFSYEDGVRMLRDVINANESWDQTTTRASTPMSLCCREIKKRHPEMAVVFSGELSDELFMGYLEWKRAPTLKDAKEHVVKRLRDVTYFDGLRADRTVSSYGMELRLPFFSREILDFVLSLSPELLAPSHNEGIEKYLLRKAFDELNYIPDEVLWRTKNAFSDATSIVGVTSWKEFLKSYAEKEITDSRFNESKELYPDNTPQTKEDMLYRDIFTDLGYHSNCIPYKWLPEWTYGITDSSATVLEGFKE